MKMGFTMTREELIELGKKIVEMQGTEEEIDAWCEQFGRNVPHPNGSGLLFWPENYNLHEDNIAQYDPMVEEIADKALSYQPQSGK